MPYPNHPKGCPNYGHKDICPPNAPVVDEYFDLNGPMWLAVEEFNLGAWATLLQVKHMDWSQRQCRNLLYWQGAVVRRLRYQCESFKLGMPGVSYTLVPEAMGVNVIITGKRVGVPIKAGIKDMVYKIALIGYRKVA